MPKPLFGFDLLSQQLVAEIEETFASINPRGDSEIERLFWQALYCYLRYAGTEFSDGMVSVSKDVSVEERLSNPERYRWSLIVEPQVQIENYRVDFLIHAWTDGTVWRRRGGTETGASRWRRLVVECDGHEFHERTKEQAAKDRSRDRELASLGYEVFRFTGSELWRDPWGCARQVVDWATAGM